MLTLWAQTTQSSVRSDDGTTKKKIEDASRLAKDLWAKGKSIKALGLIEKTISDHEKDAMCFSLHELQGDIFFNLAEKPEIVEIKCVYLFASVDAYSVSARLFPNAIRAFYGHARSLIQLGDQLGVKKFYEKAISKAKRGLSIAQPHELDMSAVGFETLKTELQTLIGLATEKIHAPVTVSATRTKPDQMAMVPIKKDPYFDQLKNFWGNLDDKTKREYLVVNCRKLIDYIQNRYDSKMKTDFRKCCVSILHTHRWRCWKCHICAQINYCFTDCKMHILDKHVHIFEPKLSARPKYVDDVLADMISSGTWEPVDTAAAANMIKDRIRRGKEFVYVNGWCDEWPVAEDEERKNILEQLAEVLKSSCPKENCTLSCSLWDWLIDYTEENLKLPEVPGSCLDICSFFKYPQCICFLDLERLVHILKYVRQLTTDVRASLVSTVVNRFLEKSLVKEKIDLEGVTTFNLLLDKRLLYDGEHELDKIGTVTKFTSTAIYDDVEPQGDKIVSWVLDCPKIDKNFVSQMAKGVHNLEIWFAALRIVRCLVRKKVSYYDKRHKMVSYEKMLGEAETICDREDRRKNANLRSRYALALRTKCEEHVNQNVGKQDDDTNGFLNVVRDVLEEAQSSKFEVLDDKEKKECISRLSTTIHNTFVKGSMLRLRKSLKEKFILINSKILMNESTYKKLIDEFPKLSAVEYRLVVLPFVRKFLKDKLKKNMKTNSNSVAAGGSAEREQKKRHL